MMYLNYNTPILDNIMKELGWLKFEDVPLFWQNLNKLYHKENYPYFISFPVEYYGMYWIYEKWFNDGKLTLEQVKEMLKNTFPAVTANHYSKHIGEDILVLLSADFYYHNLDLDNHYKFVKRFEKLTGKKYK